MTAARYGRWRSLLTLLRPSWRGYVIIWLLTLLSSAVALLQPWPIQILVDHVLAGHPTPAWLASLRAQLPAAADPVGAAAWIAFGSLIVFALDAVIDVALTISWLRVAQRSVYRLATRLFARLQRRSIAFHAVTPVGDSIARITGDSWCIYNAATALLFAPLHALAVGGAMLFILWRLNATLALIALAAAPVLAVSTLILGRRAESARGIERAVEVQIESHVQQTLSGMRVVQTYAQEDREQERFHSLAGQSVRAHRRSALIAGFSSGSAGIVTTVTTGTVLGLGAREVLRGSLTTGQLLVFLAYLATLNAQLLNLASAYIAARGLTPSIDRTLAVLHAPEDVPEPRAPVPLHIPAAGPAISLDRVSFAYDGRRPVLQDLTLVIPAGSTLAIVGESGAGKSTLAALIPRLADPTSGRILIAGTDTRLVSLDDLRSRIALVLQEPMLSADTLASNIHIGRPDATREEVEQAAARAGLAPVIANLPLGLDTPLGQAGVTLSGGERQRIAIARALLRNAPILILDEPTSALDAITEEQLLHTLRAVRRDSTTIIIAHRLSTIRHADRILVLDRGRIAAQGAHDELLQRGGLYARLWNSQTRPRAAAHAEALA